MGLATRGLGPISPLVTNGLGPAVFIAVNATTSPGVIQVSITLPVPLASEVPERQLNLENLFRGYDWPVLTRADDPVVVSSRERKAEMADYIYRQDQDGPPIGFRWIDYTQKTLIDFTLGTWTFEMYLITYDGAIAATVPNSSITGSAGTTVEPNIVIDWPTAFFDAVPVDQYMIHLKATDDTPKSRFFSMNRPPTIEIIPKLV